MEIRLAVMDDSDNSYPDAFLVLVTKAWSDYVAVSLTNGERVVAVNKDELLQAVQALANVGGKHEGTRSH